MCQRLHVLTVIPALYGSLRDPCLTRPQAETRRSMKFFKLQVLLELFGLVKTTNLCEVAPQIPYHLTIPAWSDIKTKSSTDTVKYKQVNVRLVVSLPQLIYRVDMDRRKKTLSLCISLWLCWHYLWDLLICTNHFCILQLSSFPFTTIACLWPLHPSEEKPIISDWVNFTLLIS